MKSRSINNVSSEVVVEEVIHEESKINISTKKSIYERTVLWIVTVLVLLLPIFVIPYTNVNFLYAKFGLVTLGVLVATISLILQVLHDKQIERYSIAVYGFIFGLPIVYAVSSFFANSVSGSLIGNGTEIDTAFFFFLGALLVYLASIVFRAKHTIFMLTLGLVSVSSLISIFHILRFIFGKDFLAFDIFTTIASNTVGGFNELSIYAGLSVLLCILALELSSLQKSIRYVLYGSLVLNITVMILTNFNLQIGVSVSALVALFSLILFIHKRVAGAKNSLPIVSLVVLLITIVATIGITPISNFVFPKIGISQNDTLDVRVSPGASFGIARDTYGSGVQNAILGSGPNTFFQSWGKFKPVDAGNSVNVTPFWNVDFNLASGIVPTTFVTVGILGGLMWLFFFSFLLLTIIKLLKKVAVIEKDSASIFVAWVVSVSTIYLWLVSVLFTTGPTILFMTFVSTGLLLATLVREEIVSIRLITWDVTTYWRGFINTFIMIVGIIALILLGYAWQQRMFASLKVQEAIRVLQADETKITEAENLVLQAINTYFNTSDLRFASEIALIRPTNLIGKNQGAVSSSALTEEVVNDISFAIDTARRAAIDRGLSTDYRDWLQLGKAYEAATFLGATSTATLAVESYAQAERLNPTSPIPPYLIGRLYSFAKGFEIAEAKLQRAIDLKPDYTEALTLLNSVKNFNKNSERSSTPVLDNKTSTTTTSKQ